MHNRALGLALSAVASAVVMGGLVSAPTSALPLQSVWTGDGQDGYWSNPMNWRDGDVPGDGDRVVFPDLNQVGPDVVVHHDVPQGVEYDSIVVAGNGYFIDGSELAVRVGVNVVSTGTSTIAAPLDLGGGRLVVQRASATIDLAGDLLAGFGKQGVGRVLLTSDHSAFAGEVVVEQGTLTVATDHALGLTGPGNGTVVRAGATLDLPRAISTEEPLRVAGSGVDGAGVIRSGGNSSLGDIGLAGDATVVVADSTNLMVRGDVSESGGPARLTKTGSGALVLRGDASQSGGTVVAAGTLVGPGTQSLTAGIQVGPGATAAALGGNVGHLRATGATVSAGFGAVVGVAHAASLTLDADSTFEVQVDDHGPSPLPTDVTHSTLVVDGGVDLAGATLRTRHTGYHGRVGEVLTVIASPHGVDGRFKDLIEGSTYESEGLHPVYYRVSYQGGQSGHDVTLTRLGDPGTSVGNPPAPVDATAPDTQITGGPAQGSTTSERYGAIAFSSPDTDGASFECSLNNQAFFTCGSPFVLSDLALGPQVFEVRAKDHAGNVDASPALVEWTVVPMPTDPVPPVLPAAPEAPRSVAVSGVTDGGKVYTAAPSAGLTLTGRGTPGALITVRDGQSVVGTTTVGADGTWSVRTAGLAAGRHALTATQTVGSATSAPVEVGSVTVEPLKLGLVKTITTTLAERPLVRGTGNPGAKVTVRTTSGRKLGTTTVAPNGTWRIKSPKLKRGTYKVRAIQKIAGTTATSSVITFHVKRR